jgi:ubiquinol-cytochrome c reductase cytochrome c1 subunit
MFRTARTSFSGSGGVLDKLIPGYKDKVWARVPDDWKMRIIQYENRGFESQIAKHKSFQEKFISYKKIEDRFVPSQQFRKPSVDWRRQLARGTLHIGRWFEGPNNSDYRPGKTFSRLNELVPFTATEWTERKNFRTWDGVKVGLSLWALWLINRLTSTTPVVWA